ncbi:hypothetical protein L6452_13369 [Arctium lappa]|uniref:Uncharacterized protein n=1 Tax=Arctium lappa TaxID=4217 RepID=A0ACB9CI13_ARCLA|nr:hypothetical protein L6452_13369 [Arctium lappa]
MAKTLPLFWFVSSFSSHFLFQNYEAVFNQHTPPQFQFQFQPSFFPFTLNSISIPNSIPSMGLQNQLTDVSSDSLPVFLLTVIANGVCYLRSLVYTFLHSLGIISRYRSDDVDDAILFDAVGSGLAGLILLADQLNLNRIFSYTYSLRSEGPDPAASECVVCLNRLTDGEQVRKLACQHVFHKECFDGWLDHLNFNCPLCRSPLISDERVEMTRRRMTDDVMDWFSFR